MIYKAMTYIGSNHFSALYGQNDTIIDQKATGLQHLYIDNYEKDLIHTACSTVRVDDTLYYADRMKPKLGHPKRHQSSKSYVLDHCVLVDEFIYDDFTKTDYVGANECYIRFKTVVKNTSKSNKQFQFSSLVITKPESKTVCTLEDNVLNYDIESKQLTVFAKDVNKAHLSVDAPSGFMYRGIDDLLSNNNLETSKSLKSRYPIASSLAYDKELKPNESYSFEWVIYIGKPKGFTFVEDFKEIKNYWKNYLLNINLPEEEYTNSVKTKLVALKGALLDGLLPADLTGHYFANGAVCFYSRDALMGSRAFLYAGLYKDFESIINFFLQCETKPSGEYYQRYRFDKIKDEGANNNVFTQIDFIGYFTRVITDYYLLTKKMLCSFTTLERIINILYQTNQKNGLFGPEGGVNEGVYGPAFIVSTNMFIAGGLAGVIELAKAHKQSVLEKKWTTLFNNLTKSIEAVYNGDKVYPYGYVTYHDDLINRYDTPQLLSGSLGYPLNSHYKESFYTLLEKATYYTYGFGYSEQEYHDGPWIFNTSAAAQVAYLLEDVDNYKNIMKWLLEHQNGFGLHPEAIDATNEKNSFINPLMWANSEFCVAAYSNILKKLRSK